MKPVKLGPGRPMKYGRASRAVTLTLPEDVIERLFAIDADLGRAIVALAERHRKPRARPMPRAEIAAYGNHAVIVVNPAKELKRLPGVQLVPVGDGRALIALEPPYSVPQLELDLRDLLEQGDVTGLERETLDAIADILRQSRQSTRVSLEERTIIVLESKGQRRRANRVRRSRVMKTIRVASVMAGLALACASQASAQTAAASRERPVFLDLNASMQGSPQALETSSTFPLFGETGAAATRQQPGASPLADARIGYRLSARFAVAFGFAGGRSETIGKTAATVPSAVRFASPSVVTLDAPGLKRREAGYHIQAVWFLPVSVPGNITVALSGGPSLIRVQQGVPKVAVDSAGQASVNVANETGMAKGVHVGADVARAFSNRFGVGVFVRYVAASADLPSAAGVKVGGVQAGAGIRIRF